MKNIFLLLLIFFMIGYTNSHAQEAIELKGKVIASNSETGNIHIINLNSEKGTTTDSEGNFEIRVKENDSLLFSSVQFSKEVVIIHKSILRKGEIEVILSEAVNELAEVMIDDIRLSGYLQNDINKISVKDWETTNRLNNDLNSIIEKDRELNPVVDLSPGIKINRIAGMVLNKIKKQGDTPPSYPPRELVNKSLSIVGYGFFKDELSLKDNEICNFLYFCSKDARFKALTLNENALSLIDYFQSKIESFKELRGEILNDQRQIPG